jgi:hypothetical protein
VPPLIAAAPYWLCRNLRAKSDAKESQLFQYFISDNRKRGKTRGGRVQVSDTAPVSALTKGLIGKLSATRAISAKNWRKNGWAEAWL